MAPDTNTATGRRTDSPAERAPVTTRGDGRPSFLDVPSLTPPESTLGRTAPVPRSAALETVAPS